MQVPARTHADAGIGPDSGVSRERRHDPLASFGDAIARARRDAEQQATRRAPERTTADTDAAPAHARNDDARERTRNDHDARDRTRRDDAARDRARNDGVARPPAHREEAVAHGEAASRQATLREVAARRSTPRAEARDAQPSADAAAPTVAPGATLPAIRGETAALAVLADTGTPTVLDDTDAPTGLDDTGTPAVSAETADAGAPDAANTPGGVPAVPGGSPLAALPPTGAAQTESPTSAAQAMVIPAGAAQIDETPIGEAPAGPATAAATRDLVAAPPATGAERPARGAPATAPRPASKAATDPAEVLAPDASGSEAGGEAPTADVFSREVTAAMTRHAPGETVARFGPPGSGTFAVAAAGTAPPTSAVPQGVQPPAFGSIPTPLAHPAFANHFAAEVASLALRGIERAEIVLNPKELGPVRIELSLSGETARVAFSAAQPETRQAIEQTLPILEDMLAEHGLLLSDSSVSDGRTGREPGTEAGRGPGEPVGAQTAALDARQTGFAGTAAPARAARGLVDLYA